MRINRKRGLGCVLLSCGTLAACGQDGTSAIADMRNKELAVNGLFGPNGSIFGQLIADDCPMLNTDAVGKIDNLPVKLDRGDNTGGVGKGPCYWPMVSTAGAADIEVPVTIEISDDSQRVRAVISPGPDPVGLEPAGPKTASVGGEVAIEFVSPVGAAPPIASAMMSRSLADGFWTIGGRVDGDTLRFRLHPQIAAGSYDFMVETGLFSECENAICQAFFLQLPVGVSPSPRRVTYKLTVSP